MQSLAPSQFLGDGSIPGNAAMALIAGQAVMEGKSVMEGKAVIPLSVLSFCHGPMGFVGVDAPRQGR